MKESKTLRCVGYVRVSTLRQADLEHGSLDAQADEIPPPKRKRAVERPVLRHIPDAKVRVLRIEPEHAGPAGRQPHLAKQHAQQRRLPDTVRTQHRHELAGLDLHVEVAPQRTASVPERRRLELDDGGAVGGHRSRAAAMARICPSCHV